jgi:hypothetical protein
MSEIKDYTSEDAAIFMISPLKVKGKSLQSTLSFLDDE